jgi:hypothetical protein
MKNQVVVISLIALIGIAIIGSAIVLSNMSDNDGVDVTDQISDSIQPNTPNTPDFALHGKYGKMTYMGERTVELCGITQSGSMYGNEKEQVLIDERGMIVWSIMYG